MWRCFLSSLNFMRRHQKETFPRYWPFVRRIHKPSVDSAHKGQWRGTSIFSLIGAWTNGWVNNRNTGDLRCHRAHYDVTVIYCNKSNKHINQWKLLFTHLPHRWRSSCSPFIHDDVIKWKHFPRYWPFVRGIHQWIPHTKASDAELWCLLWSAPEQKVE